MVTTGGRETVFGSFFAGFRGFGRILRGLFFEADDFGLSSEEARQFDGKFRIERLVDSRKHAAHDQARNQILGANAKFLRQILYRDTLGDRNAPRDRRRFVVNDHARRRSVALHRAFFYAARNISLAGTPRGPARTASRTAWPRRCPYRCARSNAERTRSGGSNARWMHRPPFAGTQRRTRSRRGWPRRALEDWLSGNGPAR